MEKEEKHKYYHKWKKGIESASHLGGWMNPQGKGDPLTYFPNLWDFIIDNLKIRSVLDIGCGPGIALNYFKSKGCRILGAEGCKLAIEKSRVPDYTRHVDYSVGSLELNKRDLKHFDLIYSVEFVEHVHPRYVNNYLKDFSRGKYIFMTAAAVNQVGYHHVNCRNMPYWIKQMENIGYVFDEVYTSILKSIASYSEVKFNYFENNGMFFKQKEE